MIVLDTNVVSELMRATPADVVVDWVDRQSATDVHLTAITVAELLYGVARLPDGSRKTDLVVPRVSHCDLGAALLEGYAAAGMRLLV